MKKFLTFLFSAFCFVAFAQQTVKGRVLDENNFPLPGAVISIEGGQTVVSDFDGYFLALVSGETQAKVTYVGFAAQSLALSPSNELVIVVLQPEVNALEEVVVSGFQSGVVKSLNKQRNDVNITNVVSSDQVGKFPDANIGDALKRVSGIAMQYDQGEARDIIIRGFAPGLNSVTLNGERIPSAEGDNRRVQMDLIPSDMIQLIEVSKTLTPDMEADAIGGSVNLVTRSNPNGFRFSSTLSGGANPVRDGGFNRSLALIVADKVSDRFAYTLSASHSTVDYGSDNVEFEWDDSAEDAIKEQDIRRYDVKRTRRSVSLNLDYNIDANNSLYFKSMYNSRDDWENRFRVRFDDIDDKGDGTLRIRKQTKGGIGNDRVDNRRLEDQRTSRFSLGGEHQFGKLSMDWKGSYSQASEDRPNERYIRFDQKGAAYTAVNLTGSSLMGFVVSDAVLNAANDFKYKEVLEGFGHTEEDNTTLRINFELPYGKNDAMKFGYKMNAKSKLRDNLWYEYDAEGDFGTLADATTANMTIDGYLAGAYKHGLFATPEFLGGLKFSNYDQAVALGEFAAENYNADETVNAAYLMFTDQLGPKTRAIFGARLEATNIDYTGFEYDETTDETLADLKRVTGSNSYTNILPNVTIQHSAKNMVLNAAYTVSLARPAYFDLVPYREVNSEDEEITIGNPDLEATVSNNFDFMAEYYFGNVGLISAGVYTKSIDNWIYTFSDDNFDGFSGEYAGFDYEQVRNGKSATVTGFEVGVQSKLNFLPGFLRNTTFYGNYTYTNSSTDGVEGRNDLPLVGANENMFNASLAYETKDFFLRASVNYAGESLDEVGGSIYEDRWYDEQTFVDLNATYSINDRVRIFAEAKNLTNQPLRYYQGLVDRTMQLEYYDINWNLGVKIDLR
ncbi:MAG: TonB-dependent receptor [Bacteroidetes bacterium]|nr:TonB-dependent receptor [Bacteroidota bacterium]